MADLAVATERLGASREVQKASAGATWFGGKPLAIISDDESERARGDRHLDLRS